MLAQHLFDQVPEFTTRSLCLLDATPLYGGLTNNNYHIKTEIGDFCLRSSAPHGEELGINRQRERIILNGIRHKQWAPKIFANHPELNILVTHWQDGQEMEVNQDLFKNDEYSSCDSSRQAINKILNLIKDVHSCKVSAPMLCIEQQCHALEKDLKIKPELKDTTQILMEQLPETTGTTLCHLDIRPNNLIERVDGSLLLIDWEYSAPTTPWLELAFLSLGMKLTELQKLELISQYFGLDQAQVQQYSILLNKYELIGRYLSFLWGSHQVKFNSRKEVEDYITQANNLETLIQQHLDSKFFT